MPVGDIMQVTFVCHTGQQAGLNIRHYRVDAIVLPEPPIQAAADQMSSNFAAAYQALMSNQATFLGALVRRVRPLPPSSPVQGILLSGPGTVGGDILPKQTTGVITVRTALAGRANRGRIYVPFPAETNSDTAGAPTAGYVTNLTALANMHAAVFTVAAGLGSATWTPVIFHRVAGTATPVTTALARPFWGTQRRRGDFGRPNLPPIV